MGAIGMMMVEGGTNTSGTLRFKPKPFPPSCGFLLPKANLRGPSMNGSYKTILKIAGEKQLKNLDRRVGEDNMLDNKFVRGETMSPMRILSENFTIRSYDVGPDHQATIETLMNLLQETLVNHLMSIGVLRDGFDLKSTPETRGRNLVWVISETEVVVDRYPSWGDDIQVDHWFIPYGKIGQASQWIIYDCFTAQTLARATCMLVIMNKETRKFSKMPEGVRREMELQYIECPPILDEDSSKLPKLDCSKMEHVRTGLTPRWTDLDVNQHVNNVKYVGLMLESVPISLLKNHELFAITIEYKRECAKEDVLQSQTSVCHGTIDGSIESGCAVECFHLLRFENGEVVIRGRTKWKPKHAKH